MINQRSYPTPGSVSTWMGECLRAGKPSWYTTIKVNSALLLDRVLVCLARIL